MQFLQELQVQKENEGSSTGAVWLKSKGTVISSYSPVDGKLIGSVTTTDQTAYAQIIETAQSAFTEWRNWQLQKEAKW
jgi:aldehyde dehydrogenase (NAD+)